ncbi:MAG: WYL domain-containing transcriptional regulator [Acidobacteriaceae bacterium]|nr:WYL domain-containing transcriptional regulator [Acidobacteriaceae bacterium]
MRILALLRVLGQGRSPSVHELAIEFRTRRETIYRDLRVLQDAGYPIAGDEHGRLSRPRLLSPNVPEVRFSPSERQSLLLAARQAEPALPDRTSLSSAILKLQASIDLGAASASTFPNEMLEVWNCGWKDYQAHEQHIAVLMEAILRRRRCRVTYQKPSAATAKSYEFDAYRLLLAGGALYVIGQVPAHAGSTTLAIDRLQTVTMLDTGFEPDPTFDPERCRHDAFGVSWQDPTEVVLHFRADQAPYVRERTWHPGQHLSDLTGEGVQLSFHAGGPFEIRRWILGWGDAVTVMEPAALRADVARVLESAAHLYKHNESVSRQG